MPMGNSAPCCAGPRKDTANLENIYFVPPTDPVEKELRANVEKLRKELQDTHKEVEIWKRNIRDNLELQEKQAAARASNSLASRASYPSDYTSIPSPLPSTSYTQQPSRKNKHSKKRDSSSEIAASPAHSSEDMDDDQQAEINQKLNAKQRQLDDIEETLDRNEKHLKDKADFLAMREEKLQSAAVRLTDANPYIEYLNKDRSWLHRQIIREKQKQEQLVADIEQEEKDLLFLTRQLQILKLLPLPDHVLVFQKTFNLPETECPLYEFSCSYEGKSGRLWVCARYVVFASKAAGVGVGVGGGGIEAPKSLPISSIISVNKITERMAAYGKVEITIRSPKNEEELEVITLGIKKRKVALYCLMKLAEQFNYSIKTFVNSQEFDFLANHNEQS